MKGDLEVFDRHQVSDELQRIREERLKKEK